VIITLLAATVLLNVYLLSVIPKGFFPQQDTGRLVGSIQADQSISFQALSKKLPQLLQRVRQDPAVAGVIGFIGGGSAGGSQSNGGTIFVRLKPKAQRRTSADEVIARLRGKLSQVAGVRLYLQSTQDIRVGGRQSNAQYQYTLSADDTGQLYEWAAKLATAMSHEPVLTDVNSDRLQNGLELDVDVDRETAARLQLNLAAIDNNLYDAFGQRDVSTIYNPLNQYHVVMEVAPQYRQTPDALDNLWISTAGRAVSGTESTNAVAGTISSAQTASSSSAALLATSAARNQATNSIANAGRGAVSTGSADSTAAEHMVPLAAIARHAPGMTPLAVNHQGNFVATTISFNLAPGASLSDATAAIQKATVEAGLPASIHGSFQGTARAFQESLSSEPVLILTALATIYIVLGVLYESYIHPLTILSTLPSAGTGAVLALLLFKIDFSIIALIGVILLIGIVKKNAIMMIDFALAAQRDKGLDSRDAIYEAALLRFRPIMMTTLAAVLSVLPLAFGTGDGAEIRRPLGIAIVGGLIVSQALTLYTTPVMYIYLDRMGAWWRRRWRDSP
jgi:multidrug efflux pump